MVDRGVICLLNNTLDKHFIRRLWVESLLGGLTCRRVHHVELRVVYTQNLFIKYIEYHAFFGLVHRPTCTVLL